jgi:ABC-type multidrug transport system fused ATPase/permease subunit
MKTVKLVWELLSFGERRRLVFIYFLMLVGAFLEMVSIGLIIPLVGLLSNPDYLNSLPFGTEILTKFGRDKTVFLAMLVLAMVFVLKTVFLVWKLWVQRKFSNEVTTRISGDLFNNYLKQPYSFFLRRNSANLLNTLQNSESLSASVLNPTLYVFSELLIAGGLVTLLAIVEPFGVISVFCLFGGFAFAVRKYSGDRVVRWGRIRNEHIEKTMQYMQQSFGGIKDVKILGRDTNLVNQYRIELQNSANLDQKFSLTQSIPRYGLELMTITCIIILITIMILIGRDVEDIVPVLSLFGVAAFRVLPSASGVISSFQTINFAHPKIVLLHHDMMLVGFDEGDAGHATCFSQKIELQHVSFNYDSTEFPALSDVSIRINRGEAIGLVGTSGSGKSTLTDLLMGLLEPSLGSVLVDGQNIQNRIRWWQNQIGYVSQSIFLLDDTLRRNIAFGVLDDEIDEESVVSAIRAAQLDVFVNRLSDGLDTLVGERGVRLSGGERQRIGIARALYNNPEVLVLDEATSSLDAETEHDVMKAVQALQGTKTVVIVAHRLSTVEYCDRLYRLENSRVVDEGTFSEVMNRSKE